MPYIGRNPDKGNFSDLNGGKLILDADADTSITADTDDQIDIEIAGSDELKITAAMIAPATADGSALGGASNEWSDLYLADGGVIYFGNDQDVTLTHDPDEGLFLKPGGTGDNNPVKLTLQTSETDMAADDVMGKISFQAPDEGTGTDAILVAAAIQARAEGNFSSSNNATSLDFLTGKSAAAGTDGGSLILSSTGNLTLKDLATADGSSPTLTLQTGDTDIASSDVLGKIAFQAPDEGAGTDAILVAGAIQVVSEGNFSASNNATTMEFHTAASEAAAVKAKITSVGNLLVGDGTAGAPGLSFTGDTDHGFFRTSDKLGYSVGGSERIRFDGKLILVGDTANSNNAIGMTLNQDTQDDSILALKSSDISHGITDYAEADTYLYFSKFNATGGGGAIYGLGEDNTGLTLVGLYPDTDATKSGSGHAPMEFDVKKKSGTGAGAPSSNDNLYTFEADGTVKVLFDMEGDIYHDSDVVTAYDTHDDAQLIRSIDLSKSENNSRGVIESKFDKFISYNHENLADLGLVGRESDGTPNYFVNLTGMSRLHNGAIWQQYEKHENLLNAVYELAVEAVGEDKANEILDKNDIKLLSENKLLN